MRNDRILLIPTVPINFQVNVNQWNAPSSFTVPSLNVFTHFCRNPFYLCCQMKDSDALYELVHSLSKNEKRYFKLYCSGLSGRQSSIYLLLFGLLEKQKSHDPVLLKQSIKNSSVLKNLSAEKNYLYHLILDSLLAYNREQPEQKMRTLVNKAQLLFDKGLIRSSSRLLLSAKKMAAQYRNKGLLLEIISIQSKQFVHLRDVKLMKEYADEKDTIGREILNENRYSEILAQLVNYSLDTNYMRDPEQLAKLDELMKNELMQNENMAISLQAKLLFYNIRSIYHYLVKPGGPMPENNKRMLELFNAHPDYTSINLNDYLSTIANFVSDAMASEKKEDALYALKLLEKFPGTFGPSISPVVNENYRHLNMEVISKVNVWLGEFDKVIEVLPELKSLVTNKRVLKPHRRQYVSFNTALALFANKRYKETLRLLHEVEDIHQAGSGSYVFFMQAMFLKFMTHYEIGNVDVLEEQVNWLRHLLAKQHKLHRTEEELLSFFAAIPDLTTGKVLQERFRLEHEKIGELLKDVYENPFLRSLTFVHNWIKSKAEKIEFTTATQRNAQNRFNK
jgi:hypothetical protein